MLLFNMNMMIKYTIRIALIIFCAVSSWSCKKYLDIVPDNIPTIEYAFRMRSVAERYLFTCYSFLPDDGNLTNGAPAFSGDELWLPYYPFREFATNAWEIARGNQNANDPWLYYWNGTGAGGSKALWKGIRECNIFIENVANVPDMDDYEKQKWAAEAKFLKAYYHFYLLRMFGPIPIVDQNIATDAPSDEVRVSRRPVDEVFDYLVKTLDDAIVDLPNQLDDPTANLGRITKPIAMGMKAKILVYAASPLFNGNPDYAGFTNKDGTQLFNQTKSTEKWKRAAEACREAVELCDALGYQLNTFAITQATVGISEQTKTELSIRTTLTQRWNVETIWADPNYSSTLITNHATPYKLDPAAAANATPRGNLGVPLKIAAQYYTNNGVPIEEDKDWGYSQRFNLRAAKASEKNFIKEDYITARFNFDREPRFYANLGFDGGRWYGQGRYNEDDPFYLEGKVGQTHGRAGQDRYSVTGYYPKKYVHYTNVIALAASGYSTEAYPWMLLRLADLYLLYAEAQNEAEGPSPEVYKYLDRVRERAGLPGVVESWANHSLKPEKPLQKEGLAAIIRQERGIELSLEGQRFWDLRRWKTALEVYNQPITGWDVSQETEDSYYREKLIFNMQFQFRDYFWPIREYELIVNKNLVQNPGW
jgi:hypothetical protein